MTDEEFSKEYLKSFEKGRRLLHKHLAEMPEEERQFNREFNKLINDYQKKYPEGLPFQMPYTFEELKEAYETDRPLHTWEKFKGWYTPDPEDWVL